MDTYRMKKVSEWFYKKVFKEETILPRPEPPKETIPPLLRTARSLENGIEHKWQSREALFIKQAKLLAEYEDDYPFEGTVIRYYPTYQSLTDGELRGYLSWRTKLRRGELRPTSLSFAYLYVYELLNQIGVKDSQEGYDKLKTFRDTYGQIDPSILPNLDRWLFDYVVYYELDPALLSDSAQVKFDRELMILINIQEHSDAKVVSAAKALAPRWLARSKFYANNEADMDRIIARVLRRTSDHYASRCKRSMVEQYFGARYTLYFRPFDTAVFLDRRKDRNSEYHADPICSVRCERQDWSITRYAFSPNGDHKLNTLLKAIDAVMRQEYGCKPPIKCDLETKWLLKLIHEEVRILLEEKRKEQAKKIRIDYSQLARIRKDAAVTQDKLTVEEEPEPIEAPPPPPEPTTDGDCPLEPAEYRLLRCLLYGADCSWVREEGYILSVLVDSINEKLYDTFMDSVLDDTPEPIEDYINDLKEMIEP